MKTLDTRDLEKRIEELQEEFDSTPFGGNYEADLLSQILSKTPKEWLIGIDIENVNELIALVRLREDVKDATSEWDDGAQLIPLENFKEYALELAEECNMIPKNFGWPINCIDWDFAARELKMDYSEVEFNGISYLVRST